MQINLNQDQRDLGVIDRVEKSHFSCINVNLTKEHCRNIAPRMKHQIARRCAAALVHQCTDVNLINETMRCYFFTRESNTGI